MLMHYSVSFWYLFGIFSFWLWELTNRPTHLRKVTEGPEWSQILLGHLGKTCSPSWKHHFFLGKTLVNCFCQLIEGIWGDGPQIPQWKNLCPTFQIVLCDQSPYGNTSEWPNSTSEEPLKNFFLFSARLPAAGSYGHFADLGWLSCQHSVVHRLWLPPATTWRCPHQQPL